MLFWKKNDYLNKIVCCIRKVSMHYLKCSNYPEADPWHSSSLLPRVTQDKHEKKLLNLSEGRSTLNEWFHFNTDRLSSIKKKKRLNIDKILYMDCMGLMLFNTNWNYCWSGLFEHFLRTNHTTPCNLFQKYTVSYVPIFQ